MSLGRSHTYAQPGGLGSGVGRAHHPPSPVMADQDERRITRRRRVAGFPPDSIGWPGRQEERDDPCHRTPPTRNLCFPRRGRGSARQASGACRRPALEAALMAAPRRANGCPRMSAVRNLPLRSVVASAEARCRWWYCLRQRAEAVERRSSTDEPPRRQQRQARRGVAPPRRRRARSCRRLLRDRSRDPAKARPVRAPGRTSPAG